MSDTNNPESKDYKDTVFLPKTAFPMKAGLPAKEPGILERWQETDVYGQLREARKGQEKFILHDGPPYANGDIHVGHALNHILKDMVVRTQSLLGKDAPYVPGWDCHGLPIEWKVEEKYRKKKRNKDEVPAKEFRAECREYARGWVDAQREQLKRLGIGGNWDKPYLTMDFDAEATIVAELMKFAESGQLYRGAKPVMWSPVERTALAEAEVEYEEITSTQIDVAFEITQAPNAPELVGAHAVIWTTTPWTIPVNQALAYGEDIDYVAISDGGRNYLIATDMIGLVAMRGWLDHTNLEVPIWRGKGSELAGAVAKHPMADYFSSPLAGEERDLARNEPSRSGEGGDATGTDSNSAPTRADPSPQPSPAGGEGAMAGFYTKPRPFLPGDFVTTEAGTGLVHMAPDHGEDDFDLCKAHGINPVFAVDAGGQYREDWPWLPKTSSVINKKFTAPDGPICNDLREVGALLSARNDESTGHSYPHSWRSKAKIIYRCTPQWFVPMDQEADQDGDQNTGGGTLRSKAVQAISDTRFVPEKGRRRISSMVEGRPDWVLSRQRAWGVPITLFVDRKSGEYLKDTEVNARIIAAIGKEGVDAWEEARAQEYLGSAYSADDYEMITDILDVWFDSGCTHSFVLESGKWPELLREEGYEGPLADLYLEGSDQHRGWFQSSLLQSCATRGRAPYKAVLTHGFTMDAKGMKMSKSLGNTIDPQKVMKQYGADIVRLWALSVDFTEDHRIGDEILRGVGDSYRKLRNTFRYMLGALSDFDESERVDVADMPELERYVLHLLAELDAKLRRAVDDFDFNAYTQALSHFANEDLSAFFFDIRKDCLYCDVNLESGTQTEKRRACRTVLDILFHAMVRYAAPVLVFTSEEVWQSRFGPDAESVHLLEWPEIPIARHASEGWHLAQGENRHDGIDPSLRWGDELVERWSEIRDVRNSVNEAIEPLRREKTIRSSLEANVTIPDTLLVKAWDETSEGPEIFICGDVSVDFKAKEIAVTKTEHHKCGRCWRLLPEVTEDGALCDRCEDVLHA